MVIAAVIAAFVALAACAAFATFAAPAAFAPASFAAFADAGNCLQKSGGHQPKHLVFVGAALGLFMV